jgi:hypothetical protein
MPRLSGPSRKGRFRATSVSRGRFAQLEPVKGREVPSTRPRASSA